MGYKLLGFIVWKLGLHVGRRKLAENRVKLAAGATVLVVLVAAATAARSSAD